MKRADSLLFILLLLGQHAWSQTSEYDIANIPDSVKNNASQVRRTEKIEFEVSAIDRARLNVDRVVTVMNEAGKSALLFMQETDKFITLDQVEIKVFDASGKNVGKYKQKDLNSLSIAEGLIDDSKMYYLAIPVSSFPVTVEFKYELHYKGVLAYPSYEILHPGEGVLQSSYTAKIRKDMDLRFEAKNITLAPEVTDDGKYKTYNWSVKQLVPLEEEEGAISYESRYPSILLAPNHFKLDDYEGDMTSWRSFGRWYADLKKDLDQLPEERKTFFRELVKNAKDDREKVKIIYTYVQNNFRYVSIQLGIGGFKPFSADFTEKKKYGDCKALSNYVQTVLQVVGVKSYQALVNANYNREPVNPAFPCNQFNHVIVCVPQPTDSIWLECTSRTSDFGTLGSFTENRNALLITEDGGILVATPASRAASNTITGVTEIDLKEDGSANTHTRIKATGEYKQTLINCANEKLDEQKVFFIDQLGFKDPGQITFKKVGPSENMVVTVEQEIEAFPELKSGTKMFLSPRVYKLWLHKLPRADGRRQDFYFSCPFEKTDTTIIKLPEGYKPDALPEPKSIGCGWASYTTRYWYDDKAGSIYSLSKINLVQYKIPVRDYLKVKEFFDSVLMDNLQRIVIKKQ